MATSTIDLFDCLLQMSITVTGSASCCDARKPGSGNDSTVDEQTQNNLERQHQHNTNTSIKQKRILDAHDT